MSWNYRIMEDGTGKEKYYSLREVFYADDNFGSIYGFSKEPESPIGDNVEDLIQNIKMMLDDAEKTKSQILKADMKCIGWDFKK